MKRIFFFLFIVVGLQAENVNFLNYKEGIYNGEDKPIFAFLSATYCGYCKQLKNGINSNPKLVNFINKNFTPIYVQTDIEEFAPNELSSESVPAIAILDREGRDLTKRIVGVKGTAYILSQAKKGLQRYKEQ
jgi:thioredoxin-related protein